MPLETATYISQLVTSNPAHSDGLNNADAHMRLIKGALQGTFPNFTAAPLNSTQAQIDTVITDGAATLADAGVHFKTNIADGITNPAVGQVGVSTGGTVATVFSAGGIGTATLNASTAITGPGSTPVGAMIMWFSDTLPSGAGVWAWANGQAISRTTYAAAYAVFGTTYGGGDGVATFNLPNMQEVVPVGKSTMGGAASPGLLASIAAGIKGALNGLFGTDTYAIQRSDLPNVAPGFHGASGTVNVSGSTSAAVNEGVFNTGTAGNLCTYAPNTTITVNSSGTFTPAGNIDSINGGVPQTAMPTHQPSRAVNFIIRVA